MKHITSLAAAFLLASASASAPVLAQWTNHYPKVEGYGHQLYLEQENLPILSSGPTTPAPSPDGKHVAFAHQGWIWLLDLETGVARQFTNGSGIDARPRWSPDSRVLAFVRDNGSDTSVILKHRANGAETVINTPAIELDPAFSANGSALYYTSARSGTLAIWKRDLATGQDDELIKGKGLCRSARALADGGLVYQATRSPAFALRVQEADGQTDRLLFEQGWMAHLDPDVHPTGRSVVYSVGEDNAQRLAIMDIDQPSFARWLTPANTKALHPAFSADGRMIFYVEADENQQFILKRINASGGAAETVAITRWETADELGTLNLATLGASHAPAPARLSITRLDGHPVTNPAGPTFVDNNNGGTYFYIAGSLSLQLAHGRYRVVATRGPFSLPQERVITIGAAPAELRLAIPEVWNGQNAGYASADHHVHLNASGVNELELADLLLPMQGEALDVAAPMAWNQYNRFIDAARIGTVAAAPDGTAAMLAQEVRSDFHGHVGAIGLAQPFNPWFFGPNTPAYVTRDINNGEAVAHVQAHGALPTYVHPVDGSADPFADLSANPLPYELVLDGVLADGVGLELVCQWTSALGTAEIWYRFLNIGKAMPATAGTDMMANFYRTPAIGTARAYVPVTDRTNLFGAVLGAVRKGTGFVTTGPALEFAVAGQTPGDIVAAGTQAWTITLASVKPVDKVEILVNGKVVETLDGFAGQGAATYEGTVDLPEGGWVAARAVGGETGWPSMTVMPFAHSSPIWIGKIGSTDETAARSAARDLLRALAYSEEQFAKAYTDGIPRGLAARIAEAQRKLELIADAR